VTASASLRRALVAVLIAVPIVWIYGRGLGDAPVYLHHDEVLVALNAHAIAETGRDPTGARLPLYFRNVDGVLQTPVSIYCTALVFKLLPVSEASIRVPSVIVGLVTVVLMYFLARALFHTDTLAVIAAVLLALTPALFIHSRLGFDHHYPALFVTGWLLGLVAFLERPRLRSLFLATLTLGVGVYSYLASLVMMPIYFCLTCAQLLERHRRTARVWLVAIAGFALPLTLLVVWTATHRAQYAQSVGTYKLYDSSKLNPLQGLHEMLSYTSLTERSSVYYTAFDPSFLLFGGDTSMVHSTRRAGVFLFPVGAFLALGLYRILTRRRAWWELLLVAGLLVSPLAAAIVAEPYRISRQMVMIPFAILIATRGVEWGLGATHRAWRIATIALLAAVPIQFALFNRDYMTDYRVRSAGWFEGNIRGAVDAVMAREPIGSPRPVYFGTDIAWSDSYWQLYAVKHRRPDLARQVRLFDPKAVDAATFPAGSFVISRYVEPLHAAFERTAGLRTVALLPEPNGSVLFAALEK
jgi:4-amino-4-deoxy-L-arabinose transferase-like glycosyltransferase